MACAALHDLLQVVFGQRLQHVDRGARQQRRVHLERRVLGGGADEGEEARFDVRQEGVLLALVEAVHLVDEDDGAAAAAPCAICACSTASRMSFTPPSTALMVMNCASKASAISRAMVVLPVPGGPHRMQLCGWPDSKAMRSGMPSPSRCCWPITSPSDFGRRRSASGGVVGGLAAHAGPSLYCAPPCEAALWSALLRPARAPSSAAASASC